MSQWNNSYAYNDQYQGASNWNGELSSQYLNQGYYPNRELEGGNQYVSFNEFLSQMQNSSAATPNSASYNSLQYQNYPPGQYNYQNIPPNSQATQPDMFSPEPNGPISSNALVYQPQTQYNTMADPNSLNNEVVFKSTLTATASEFVPKNSAKASCSTQNVVPESSTYNEVREPKTLGSALDTNWRERPQQNGSSRQTETYKQGESGKQEPNNYKRISNSNREPNSHKTDLTRTYDSNNRYEASDRNNETSNRNNETSNRKNTNRYETGDPSDEPSNRHESSGRSKEPSNRHESSGRSNEPSNRYDSSSRNEPSNRYESGSRSNESGNRSKEPSNRYESSSRSNQPSNRYESSSRNNESSSRSKEPSNRYESSSRSNEPSNRYESSSRSNEPSNRYESSSRSNEPSNRYDSSSRSYEPSNRYESSNRNNESSSRFNDNRGQSKSSSKAKSKEARDAERTFYNSAINKGTQDVRNGRENSGRSRNWVGSQRVRPVVDRNIAEDEQYANSYLQFREEKSERDSKSDNVSSPIRIKNKPAMDQVYTELTQRERLSQQLDKGTLECLVCCERVKQIDSVWSCTNCYHVLHLRCIRKWALSSIVEGKWRCPACQNTSEEIPSEYRCMCGAVRSPDYQRGSGGAHTCGRSCKRPRSCPHPCPMLCHPGPCPPCQATITKHCGCGAEERTVVCSNKASQECGRECRRALTCGVHACAQPCHEGPCDQCQETVTQVCYCQAAKSRSVPCTAESGASAAWTCGGPCSRILPCGAHTCKLRCHPPPCHPCDLLPEVVLTCPCGKTQLVKDKRKKCTDPIPLCGNICAKLLPCGPAGDKHFCKFDCHEGECAACPDTTALQCRCGHSSRDVPCTDLPDMLNNVLCQKKCNKKLSCGRHRCRTVCCAAQSHRCAVVCGRTLSCQLHRCEEFCHTGHCAPCPRVSFEELSCECGAEVLLPPVRCGSKPPVCSAECRRRRACGHPPHHSCHSGDCPPCVMLTAKMCHGQHEERKTIPCSQEEFSCGLPCGKPLPCGKHTCIKTCHKGPCDTGKCTQPCNEKRPSCGHGCAAPCHAGAESACPSAAPCRRLVRATCPCGRQHADRPCAENARDLAKIMSTLAATKMQEGGSVDLSDVQRPGAMLKTLECDDECRVEARTRQLALALQIRNPDVSAKLAPRYSDHVRATAAKEPAFAHQIHDRLTDLVQLAKKSKQKTRSHSFPSMNWQKRQFIHELCEHFGCESVAYDAEPNRNVVATADKEKSWLPAMSVLEVLAREAGKRRVPGPMLRAPAASAASLPSAGGACLKSSSGWATLTSTNAWAARCQNKRAPEPASPAPARPPPAAKIDYFDNPPDN